VTLRTLWTPFVLFDVLDEKEVEAIVVVMLLVVFTNTMSAVTVYDKVWPFTLIQNVTPPGTIRFVRLG
jgi:hypothetical protein